MAKNQNEEVQVPNINLIGNGTNIVGDININGDIRIDGTLKGNLNGQGRVVVGQSGSIEGEINCQCAEVSGIVIGKILAQDSLIMRNSAKITGNIKINKLSIEPGAIFNGNCEMNAQTDSQQNAEELGQTE